MIPYRSFYFYIRPNTTDVIILDSDKTVVTFESSLSSAKRFIDQLLDVPTTFEAVNDFNS